MTVLDAQATLSGSVGDVVTTGAAADQALVSNERARQADRKGWQDIIDKYLVEWGRDPGQLEDEDLVPPSLAVIRSANELAMELRNREVPPPLRVIPDGEGGIAFERRVGEVFLSLTITAGGAIELDTFVSGRLQSRELLVSG